MFDRDLRHKCSTQLCLLRRLLWHANPLWRWVGIGEVAASALRDYVERFRGEREGMLFLSSLGEALTTGNSLRIILRRIGDAVGVQKVHPHRFRHTFATWAIQSGAREIDVQMLLGHSDLTMTQRYARTYTSEQAIQAHGDLSPVAQLDARCDHGAQHGEIPAADSAPLRNGIINRALVWQSVRLVVDDHVPVSVLVEQIDESLDEHVIDHCTDIDLAPVAPAVDGRTHGRRIERQLR